MEPSTTKCEKRTVTCDVETTNVRKKVRELPNMRKELSHVMLKLHNVKMKPSNMRKKVRESPNVRKELSHVMLELHNVRIHM